MEKIVISEYSFDVDPTNIKLFDKLKFEPLRIRRIILLAHGYNNQTIINYLWFIFMEEDPSDLLLELSTLWEH